MDFRCSHILLSHVDAESASHPRSFDEAYQEAQRLLKEIKKGNISFQEAAAKNSHCASGPRNGGDLGWKNEFEMPYEFVNAVRHIPIGDICEFPIITDTGIHIVLRTG